MPNLFDKLPRELAGELNETLVGASMVRVARIVSHGHRSPDGFWYDQDENEWVIVLRGQARLRLDGVDKPLEMRPGDYVNIPARQRHRVEWTTPDEPTVWLAIHYRDAAQP
jgi:cupin 2 domain-containing protein